MRFGWAKAATAVLVLATAACGQAGAAGDPAAKNAAEAEFFLTSNARQPGITTLPIMLGGVPARNIRDTNYGRPNTRYADNIGLSKIKAGSPFTNTISPSILIFAFCA